MAIALGRERNGVQADINVTPLIDVVLVLLIIFMVLTPSMLKHLRIAVPNQATDAAAASPGEIPIVVEYTAQRKLTVNTEPVSPDALATKLAERLRSDAKRVVFFKAEDQAPYGEVVRLMDVARGAGAKILAVVTK